MIKLFIFSLLFSCASVVKLPKDAEVLTKDFSSATEARNYVRNKSNFLTLLFEQSYDPYYGQPRWPQECLKKNQLSKPQETHGNIYFRSQLFLNERKDAGFCTGNLQDVIYLQCKSESRVHEIYCSPGVCQDLLNGNPCPLTK